MVKKVSKVMTILSVLTVAFVGVNSAELVATNVNASYESNNTHYLSVYWENWRNEAPPAGVSYTQILSVKVGGVIVKDFRYLMENKTALFGMKDVYINLNGVYDLSLVDSETWENYTYNTYHLYSADAITFDSYVMKTILNGDLASSPSFSTILAELNYVDSFYIIRTVDVNDAIQIFNDGVNHGINIGDTRAREEYGIYFNNDWQTAEWYGDYMYDKGLNETDATGFGGLLTAVFGGLGSLLSIEILPGIYIGAIIAVPLVFGIVFFILGKRKGD